MTRTRCLALCGLLFGAGACSAVSPKPQPAADCSVGDAYEFKNIFNFDAPGSQTGWFVFADPTPLGMPNPAVDGSNLQVTTVDPPGRCGDTNMVELRAYGHNFYGTGYGDYAHNNFASRANGDGYEGISFWARSVGNTDKTFMFFVDDGRTILLPVTPVDGGTSPGPGDILAGTECRLPPPQALGTPACYNSGTLPPATPTRIPEPNECGNQFHTYITVADDWQLFLIPWRQLVQWPCPNRLEGGIDPTDIRELEIKFIQGTNYDVLLDNIAFYRSR